MNETYIIPNLGKIKQGNGLVKIQSTSDNKFKTGENGVQNIFKTGDAKLELVAFENHTLCFVPSVFGYDAYYPLHDVELKKPVKAVLMDLDGTSVKSEEFWISIIEATVSRLTDNSNFRFSREDIPYVSGHSVSEHLSYSIEKYCPSKTLQQAREIYFEITSKELGDIVEGRGRKGAFSPAKGLRNFLLKLKENGIKVGLVTSGLYEKAWPEIVSAFDTEELGNPLEYYDSIICTGTAMKKGAVGTMTELIAKPHPWLYAESGCVGLGIDFNDRNSIVCIEDSGAGVCSARLSGYNTIGIAGGNIEQSGTKDLCGYCCDNLDDILKIII